MAQLRYRTRERERYRTRERGRWHSCTFEEMTMTNIKSVIVENVMSSCMYYLSLS